MEQPQCVTHKKPMAPRPVSPQTAEQKWCGTWYDCPVCTNSVLIPSDALTAQLAQQRKTSDVPQMALAL